MEQQKKTFAVKLKGLAPWISEVQYKKEEQDLILSFTLKKAAEVNIILEDEGAQRKLFSRVAAPLAPLSQRLISGVEYKPNLDLYITMVSHKDFRECAATPLALKAAVEELKQCGAESSSLLVLFETARATQGLLWSANPNVRGRIKALRQGAEKGNWVLFAAPEPLAVLRQEFKTKL